MKSTPLRSMTGFSRARVETALGQFSVELRSVNYRFHEASVSLPRELGHLEMRARALLRRHIERGKLDCRVRWLPADRAQPEVRLNMPLAQVYIARLDELRRTAQSAEIPLATLASLPGVLETMPPELDENQLWESLESALESVLKGFDSERTREGEALRRQLAELGARLRELATLIEARKDSVVRLQRERLAQRIAELEDATRARVEPGRLELELAMYADRADISEELVRLGAHFDRYEQLLAGGDEPVGRALDFLVQELQREVNTIMSKARDTELTGHGLEMKSAIEKIREQIQNIE